MSVDVTMVWAAVIAFVVLPMASGGEPWSLAAALAVATTNYIYKFAIAVGSTPLLYFTHSAIKSWLGPEVAQRLAHEAHPRDPT